MGLQGVTRGYKGLQEVTRGYRRLQGVTRGYMGLQRVTVSYKGLQGFHGHMVSTINLVEKIKFFHVLSLSKRDREKVIADVLHTKEAIKDYKNISL